MAGTSSRRRLSLQMLERHGDDLHAVASVLTADPDLVARLVVNALTTPLRPDQQDLRLLSAIVVRDWLDGHPERIETMSFVSPTPLDAVHGLTVHQRAALALCRFGDHSYRAAATLLDLPAVTVAGLLDATMRTLTASDAAPGADDVTELRAV